MSNPLEAIVCDDFSKIAYDHFSTCKECQLKLLDAFKFVENIPFVGPMISKKTGGLSLSDFYKVHILKTHKISEKGKIIDGKS